MPSCNTYHLTWVSLTSGVGYLFTAAPAKHSQCSLSWMRGIQYATGDQWRNNSRKNEEAEPKQKQHPFVDVTGDGSKVRCSKEQYCIGTWNVRSMNEGKLEVVKQEMARVNVNILGIIGISELKNSSVLFIKTFMLSVNLRS